MHIGGGVIRPQLGVNCVACLRVANPCLLRYASFSRDEGRGGDDSFPHSARIPFDRAASPVAAITRHYEYIHTWQSVLV
jgi:hypothetical protein